MAVAEVKYNEKKRTLKGTGADDVINAPDYGYVAPTEGKNKDKGLTITGGKGNDFIIGTIYNDVIKGGDGNDTITGTLGLDKITGGKGSNLIEYTSADQLDGDIVYLTKGENLTIDVKGITTNPDDITYRVDGKNLEVTVNGQEFTVKNYGKKDVTGKYGSVRLVYGSGENDYVDLKQSAVVASDVGTFHNDFIDKHTYFSAKNKGLKISGKAGNDSIIGTDYKDTIKGGDGDDTITAGAGNDKLYGEKGCNTFIFSAGDGNDTIYSGKGDDTLEFNDISFNNMCFSQGTTKKTKNDLIIQYGNGDSITVKNYYKTSNTIRHIITSDGYYDLSNIIFGNGNINGNDNNNIIFGSNENDSINVAGGNNTIYTKNGDDTILLGNGENNIYIGIGEKTITTGSGETNIIYKPENIGGTENFGTHTINYTKDSTLMLDLRGLNISSTGVLSYSIINNGDLKIETVRGNIIISGYDDEAMESESGGVFVHFAGGAYATNLNTITSVNVGLDAFVNGEYTGNKLGEIINASGLETPTSGEAKGVTINAGAGNDNIIGSNFDDTINGEAGADTIVLLNGEDIVSGGSGNDTISASGGTGNKHIDGGVGDDKIYGCQGANYTDTLIGGAGEDEIYGYGGNDIIYGDYTLVDDANQTSGDDDKLYGGEGSDTIYGGGGSDTITSKAQPSNSDRYDNTEGTVDELHGGAGDDFIYGQSKKNIMYGDEGSDYIEGRNEGEDIFRFKLGDGVDTIKGGDDSTIDTIDFYNSDDNIDLDSLTPTFNGNDLVISYSDTDKIIIKDYIKDGQINSSIDTIKFADGTTKSIKTDLEYEISTTSGGTITGTVLSDYISTSNEADTIYAGIGDDFIIPNKGDDIIYGGSGANTYYINPDSGINTIYSTSAQDIIHINYVGLNSMAFAVEGDDVVITNDYDSTKVIVKDYLNSLHNIIIKDNSNFTSTIIEKLEAAGIIVGSGDIEGNDNPNRIIGSPETDIILGKGGADIMNGAGGADTYIIRNNDGHDAILSGTDGVDDIINFTDSKFEDLIFTTSNDGKDVVITHNSGNDSVTLKNFFEEGNTNTTIIDSDEEEFNILNNAIQYIAGEGDGATLTGSSLRDNITGTDGNDTITAGKNNDTIITGGGHDTLNFSNGDGHDIVILSDNNTQTDIVFSSTALMACSCEVNENDVIIKYNKDTNNNYLDSITVKDYLLEENENKIHDTSFSYDLLLDDYVTNVITNQSGNINGTRIKDRIYDSNSDDIIHAGKGNDTITISNAGSDYVYGEDGDDEITATQSTGNKYIDGGEGDDYIYGCNKADYSDTIVGGLGTDNIYGGNGNDIIYGDYTLEDDATQTTGVNDNLNGGLGSDTIYGGGGNDQIQGYGNFWSTSGKDTSTGIVDRLYGGAGNDSLYGASETTYMYGGSGNDTYYMYIDQNNIMSDTEGTNNIVIYNTANTNDNYYTNLHIVFNVSKSGVLDENGLRILNAENYNIWQNNCNDEDITGVKVVSGANSFSVQTAYSSGGGHEVTNISELISSVANWLHSGGRNYDDVSAALASNDKADLLQFIATNTNWDAIS